MRNKVQSYLYNLGSNFFSFSKAAVVSSVSLVNHPATTKIARALITISVDDFFPAAFAYALDSELQNTRDSYQESTDYNAIIGAYALHVVLSAYIFNKVIRGTVRSFALSSTIPLLVNNDDLEQLPPVIFNSRIRSEKALELIKDYLMRGTLQLILPRTDLYQSFIQFWIGSRIVHSALDNKTLTEISNAKVTSLPFIVGGTYLLLTKLAISGLMPGVQNPWLELLIDNIIYMALFSVIAKLKINQTELLPESYSLNFAEVLNYIPVEIFLRALYIQHKSPDISKQDELALRKMVLNVSFSAIKKFAILPNMLHTPEQFFDDNLIKYLLDSLPKEARIYIHNNWSMEQIRLLFLQFKLVIKSEQDLNKQYRILLNEDKTPPEIFQIFPVEKCVMLLQERLAREPSPLTKNSLFRPFAPNTDSEATILNGHQSSTI